MAIGVLALAGVAGLLFVPAARAAEFIEGGEVVIAADQVIEDDLYVSAGSFVLEGKVLGDLIVADAVALAAAAKALEAASSAFCTAILA